MIVIRTREDSLQGIHDPSAIETVVVQVLGDVCREYGREAVIASESSLMDDLGFDSLMFVDLTVLLEDRLGVEEFPMRAWADHEAKLPTARRYTVGSLVRACIQTAAEADAVG